MLEELFISRVRVKILQLFLSTPGEQRFHVRDIVRRVDEEINAVRRELERMLKFGMVSSEWRANRRFYEFKKDYIYYPELLSLVAKTTGLGGALIKNKSKIGRIKYAMLSGKFVREKNTAPNEVDLLVVGNVVLPELAVIIKAEEAKKDQEINYTVMTEEEFNFRKRRNDPFISEILSNARVMLIGDEEEMLK